MDSLRCVTRKECLIFCKFDIINSSSFKQTICSEVEEKVLRKHRGKLLHLEAFKKLCKTCEVRIHEEFLALCLLTLQARRQVALQYKMERETSYVHLIKIPGIK